MQNKQLKTLKRLSVQICEINGAVGDRFFELEVECTSQAIIDNVDNETYDYIIDAWSEINQQYDVRDRLLLRFEEKIDSAIEDFGGHHAKQNQ